MLDRTTADLRIHRRLLWQNQVLPAVHKCTRQLFRGIEALGFAHRSHCQHVPSRRQVPYARTAVKIK